MSSATVGLSYTPQQYLALERKAAVRSEYFDGTICATAGANRPNYLIAANLCRELSARLRD
jgi:hypothetical protein